MKRILCFCVGVCGSAVASWFGGFDAGLKTLLVFMAIDYVSGLIVAGVFHKSPKSANGALESKAGWKGLLRKGGTLLVVLICSRLDVMFGTSFVRDAAVIAYVVNESISILENLGLMGVPIPTVVRNSIEALTKKEEDEE